MHIRTGGRRRGMANSLVGAVQGSPLSGRRTERHAVSPAVCPGSPRSISLVFRSPRRRARCELPSHFALIQVPFRCISHGDVRLVDGTPCGVHPASLCSATRPACGGAWASKKKIELRKDGPTSPRFARVSATSATCSGFVPWSRSGTERSCSVGRRSSSSRRAPQPSEAGLRWWSTI